MYAPNPFSVTVSEEPLDCGEADFICDKFNTSRVRMVGYLLPLMRRMTRILISSGRQQKKSNLARYGGHPSLKRPVATNCGLLLTGDCKPCAFGNKLQHAARPGTLESSC